VVNPRSLVTELEMLAEKGVDTRRLVISDRDHLYNALPQRFWTNWRRNPVAEKPLVLP
jgi:adenylosuccinate synthase